MMGHLDDADFKLSLGFFAQIARCDHICYSATYEMQLNDHPPTHPNMLNL